jgi:protein-disulfide isomerase
MKRLLRYVGPVGDAASLLVVVAGGVALWVARGGVTHPTAPATEVALPANTLLDVARLPVLGSQTAPVVIVEFADFQCPYCRRHYGGVFKDLKKEFIDTGVVAYAFVNLPMESIHPQARFLADVGICAGRQGRFWQMHDLLFERDIDNDTGVQQAAAELGLQSGPMMECLQDDVSLGQRIDEDMGMARALRVNSTPTFAFGRLQGNGRALLVAAIHGAQPLTAFRKEIGTIDHTRN